MRLDATIRSLLDAKCGVLKITPTESRHIFEGAHQQQHDTGIAGHENLKAFAAMRYFALFESKIKSAHVEALKTLETCHTEDSLDEIPPYVDSLLVPFVSETHSKVTELTGDTHYSADARDIPAKYSTLKKDFEYRAKLAIQAKAVKSRDTWSDSKKWRMGLLAALIGTLATFVITKCLPVSPAAAQPAQHQAIVTDNNQQGGRAQPTITSNNQSGGFTGIMNVGQPERHLTDIQKRIMIVNALRLVPSGSVIPVTSNTSQEAKTFALEFVVTFRGANLKSDLLLPIPELRPDIKGVFIGVRDKSKIPQLATSLAQLLSEGGIQFNLAPMEPDYFPNDEVVLIVGAQ